MPNPIDDVTTAPWPTLPGEEQVGTDLQGCRHAYRILRRLAAGGMAEVFLAEETESNGPPRKVVIKMMHRSLMEDGDSLTMFLQEARLAAQLHHPNIVRTLDIWTTGDRPCIVMEYLDGWDVLHLLNVCIARGKPPSAGTVAALVSGAARGLGYAHRAKDAGGNSLQIVHRDVAPPNLFVTGDGVVKVLDFGIARATGQVPLTREGHVRGKLPYMSPEQMRRRALDARTDHAGAHRSAERGAARPAPDARPSRGPCAGTGSLPALPDLRRDGG
jgi:eukaryotic-like serine/threonine-protein kinase